MSERDLAAYPRDKLATMASDYWRVHKVLRMCADRALTGTPLHIKKSVNLPFDVIETLRASAHGWIDDIFSTAVLDEPEPPNADASQ